MNKLKFVLLSIFGFVFFLVPFEFMGEKKIAISHIVKFITGNILGEFIGFTMICSWIVLLGTIIFMIYTSKNEYLNGVFKASAINRLMRIAGSFLYLLVLNKWFD